MHIYSYTHRAHRAFWPKAGGVPLGSPQRGATWDFPGAASSLNLTGRQAGRSRWAPSRDCPLGGQRPGSGNSNCSAVVLREMLAEELWECYEQGRSTRGLLSVAILKKHREKREGSLFFSCIPKDLCKHACPALTAVRGDGDLPGSSLAGEHPQPQRDASVAVWFPPPGPSVASPAPAPEHHQHPESQAAGAGCPGPQPAALRVAAPRWGGGKARQAQPRAPRCSLPGVAALGMDRRDGLQLLHKTISPQRHQPLRRTEGRAREKQSPGEGSSSGKLAPPAEPPLLLLAFLSLCALKTAILEEQEDPNHDICVKMKGMQMFGVFCLDLEFLFCST